MPNGTMNRIGRCAVSLMKMPQKQAPTALRLCDIAKRSSKLGSVVSAVPTVNMAAKSIPAVLSSQKVGVREISCSSGSVVLLDTFPSVPTNVGSKGSSRGLPTKVDCVPIAANLFSE
jgi:hypothetical protein